MTGNSSGLLVIASVAKQSPTWNKYSNYYFLSAEIATGTVCPRNDCVLSNEIATGASTLAMTVGFPWGIAAGINALTMTVGESVARFSVL